MQMTSYETEWLKELGIALYRARIKRRETLTVCGDKLGISRQTYRKIEQGCPTVDIGNYVKALSEYGILRDALNLPNPRIVNWAANRQAMPQSIHSTL